MTKIQEIYPEISASVMSTIEDLERYIRSRQIEIENAQRAIAALKLVATESVDPIGDAAAAAVAGELSIPTFASTAAPDRDRAAPYRKSPLATFRNLVKTNGEGEAVALVTNP